MNYNPPDAYVVTWKPSFWYNDIDGLRTFWAKRLTTPLSFNLAIGVNYTELSDDKAEYACRRVEAGKNIIAAPTWSVGKVNQAQRIGLFI